MKISNVRVYGLEESIIASAYPFATQPGTDDLPKLLNIVEKDIKRATHLGSAKSGSGHDCFLKGIIVQYDLKAPEYFWRQFDRYHFHDYVSSMSKMHCLKKFEVKKMCNNYVDDRVIDILNEKINQYNENPTQENFQNMVSNVPAGFELTARITDNYLQLKSKYYQRNNHPLEEWEHYRNWMRELPLFNEIVLKGE